MKLQDLINEKKNLKTENEYSKKIKLKIHNSNKTNLIFHENLKNLKKVTIERSFIF